MPGYIYVVSFIADQNPYGVDDIISHFLQTRGTVGEVEENVQVSTVDIEGSYLVGD